MNEKTYLKCANFYQRMILLRKTPKVKLQSVNTRGHCKQIVCCLTVCEQNIQTKKNTGFV